MSNVVLDASVLLAVLLQEPDHEDAVSLLDRARMSSVNLAEAVTKLTSYGRSAEAILYLIRDMEIQVEPLDGPRAIAAGLLVTKTAKAGLSLGDRACLSLASELGLRAVTSDKAWTKVDADVEIEVIR